MYVCMYVVYVHPYVYVDVYVYVYVYINVYVCVHVRVSLCTYVYVYVYACVYVSVCVYVHVYVYRLIHTCIRHACVRTYTHIHCRCWRSRTVGKGRRETVGWSGDGLWGGRVAHAAFGVRGATASGNWEVNG